jgi:AT-rich interactive domain-containing protein 4B
MEDSGKPINRMPMIDGHEVDLYRLFRIVHKLGGHARVTNKSMWQQVAKKLGFETAWCINRVKPFSIFIGKNI